MMSRKKKDRVNKIKDQIKEKNNQIVDNNKNINKKRQRLDEIKKEIATTKKIKENRLANRHSFEFEHPRRKWASVHLALE